MRQYVNVCICGDPCAERDTAELAQSDVQEMSDFSDAHCKWLRIEERWNGHVRCTPVGMRADQASHRWAWNGRTANGFKLEPRHD